jgi:hypothetical protein
LKLSGVGSSPTAVANFWCNMSAPVCENPNCKAEGKTFWVEDRIWLCVKCFKELKKKVS